MIRGDRHSGGGEYLLLAGLLYLPWRFILPLALVGALFAPASPTVRQNAQEQAATRASIQASSDANRARCAFQDWRQAAGPKLNGPMGGRTPLQVTGFRQVGTEIFFRFEGEDYRWPDRLPE
jgi:hypothetical protein